MRFRISLVVFLVCFISSGSILWAGGSGENQASTGEGTKTLRFSWWGGDNRVVLYDKICTRFEEDTPGIKIEREPASWNDYFNRLSTQVAGGSAPDIIQMHPQYAAIFASPGVFLSLDDPIPKSIIDFSHFSQAALDSQVVDGYNMMVSIGLSTNGLITNTNILSELGIPLSRLQNLTYTSYEALLIEIAQKAGGKYWSAADDSVNLIQTQTPITMFFRSRGKDLFTKDGKVGFGKEEMSAWLAYHQRLRQAKAIPLAQISAEEAAKTYEQTIYITGKQVFYYQSCNRLKVFQDIMPNNELIIVRGPTNNGKGGEIFETANIGIYAKTKFPREAAAFINYFVNNPRSLELYLGENGFPASSVMNEHIRPFLGKSDKLASVFMDDVTKAFGGQIAPRILAPSNSLDYVRILLNESEAVAFGQKTIEKAVDDFFAAAGKL
jgi:multiple sugar transport system substrate-binding protein